MGDFRKLIKEIHDLQEETTSGDIATVDNKLGSKPVRNLVKGKKCKKHKRVNCLECSEDADEL